MMLRNLLNQLRRLACRAPAEMASTTADEAAAPPPKESPEHIKALGRAWPQHQPLPQAEPCNLGPNDGVLDPSLGRLLSQAAHLGALSSEPEHFQAGYVSGHRHGWVSGAVVGIVIGASLVAAAVQVGVWGGAL